MDGLDDGTHHDDGHDMLHAVHLENTLQELLEKVREHEAALEKLRTTRPKDRQAHSLPPTASLDIMKAAYDDLASQTPFLPFPDSVLPALVALQKTHQTVEETKAYLAGHNESVDHAEGALESEKTNLKDQEALERSLRDRIQALRSGLENRMEMSAEDIARERVTELKQKKKQYDRDTSKLLKFLRNFIDNHLAGMLAAEELGGPVVGDMMDIDGDDLAAGFSSQGRLKKPNAKSDDGKRQRRIDEIWGARVEEEEGEEEQGQRRHGASRSRDETTAAGIAMRDLTEELLNSLAQSEGDSSAAYVQLDRESAAARFLVRSKVAQFHPKDATKLRLIDFGRELDD
ncbi:hypothetical protein F4780DRAFT_582288 [Xylariomycetidae sp. FL0641]|nr:hypothetical protein F4780DRAFT_582288 [Xylariomycetidae sp. FL0641]